MTKLMMMLSAAAIALTAPTATAQTPETEMGQSGATLLTVDVKGMVCDFCAQAVTKIFGRDEAVEGVHVDLNNGEIHVRLKPGMALSDEEVEALVKKSGYAMVSVEREAL